MSYTALPSRRIAYDTDGTVLGFNQYGGISGGPLTYLSNSILSVLNDFTYQTSPGIPRDWGSAGFWFFFPEKRVVNNAFIWIYKGPNYAFPTFQGSPNTTNGLDGTWETPTYPDGTIDFSNDTNSDTWRSSIRRTTFTQSVVAIRMQFNSYYYGGSPNDLQKVHLYGYKDAGQSPDDLIFTNTSGTELSADVDFGDVPVLTNSSVTQFKIKNTSSTKTAYNIFVSTSNTEVLVSADGNSYSPATTITSLGPGASSATLYVRSYVATATSLGPRAHRLVATPQYWA